MLKTELEAENAALKAKLAESGAHSQYRAALEAIAKLGGRQGAIARDALNAE